MDLFSVIAFLVLYYVRPQEWTEALANAHFVQITMLLGLGSLFFRDRSLRFADLFRTPHDWAVLGFWLWLVLSSATPWETFKDNANIYVFYIVIVQTLYSIPRTSTFVGWWTYLVAFVAALALASLVGIDPLGSAELTESKMQGRLSLNLGIFNNPNALGHSVVPAIPMVYYYCIWKRPMSHRVIGFILLAALLTCIYLTLSKGAFLAGAATIVATLTFGRPKAAQVTIIAASLLFGSAVLYSLPRMNELDKSKSDAAIQGRVGAFKFGYRMLTTTYYGIGKGKWAETIQAVENYYIAGHSSYVVVGAELGYPGLFLLCAILYCDLRTVVTAKTESFDEERIRRMLFVLVVSYIVSSWMVNFEYRPTFFMFTAAIAALHRHLHGLHARDEEALESASLLPTWQSQLVSKPALERALPQAGMVTDTLILEIEPALTSVLESAPQSRIGSSWNRIGVFDLAVMGFMTWAVVRYWAYIMVHM